jgi:HEAT repeat protein
MQHLSATTDIGFQELIDDLLEGEIPLNPRYLYRFSDLVEAEINLLKQAWSDIVEWRRQALLEDLEALFATDTLLSFEAICRIALEDSNPQIRFLAMRSLQEYEVVDLIPTFIQIMMEDKDEEIRAMAAINLGKYVYLGEVDTISKDKQRHIEDKLLQVAHSSDSSLVRRKAVEALGYSSNQQVPKLIKAAYQSGKPEWIASALFAMGRTIDPRWQSEIETMLDSAVSEIRFEAIRAAGELEISSARFKLINCLDASESEIRMAAVWSLARIGGEGIQAIFEILLQQAEVEEEIQIIEDALEHLIFTQSLDSLDDFDGIDPDIYEEQQI